MYRVQDRIINFYDNWNTHLSLKKKIEGQNKILGGTIDTELYSFTGQP